MGSTDQKRIACPVAAGVTRELTGGNSALKATVRQAPASRTHESLASGFQPLTRLEMRSANE